MCSGKQTFYPVRGALPKTRFGVPFRGRLGIHLAVFAKSKCPLGNSKPKNRSRKAGIGFVDFASGGKRACGYRQTAENEAVGVERPFRAHGKDFLQPREGRLSGAGRGVGIDRVGENPLSYPAAWRHEQKGFSCP